MSSGARFNSGKPKLSCVPLSALAGVAKVFEWAWLHGPYRRFNWTLGLSVNATLDSALRHLADFQGGGDVDPESQLDTIDHALTNLIMIRWLMTHRPEFDDRDAKLSIGDRAVPGACQECGQVLVDPRGSKTVIQGQPAWLCPECTP